MENRDMVKKFILNESIKQKGNLNEICLLNREVNKEKIKQEIKKELVRSSNS